MEDAFKPEAIRRLEIFSFIPFFTDGFVGREDGEGEKSETQDVRLKRFVVVVVFIAIVIHQIEIGILFSRLSHPSTALAMRSPPWESGKSKQAVAVNLKRFFVSFFFGSTFISGSSGPKSTTEISCASRWCNVQFIPFRSNKLRPPRRSRPGCGAFPPKDHYRERKVKQRRKLKNR